MLMEWDDEIFGTPVAAWLRGCVAEVMQIPIQ
jgi:hypothetical protein